MATYCGMVLQICDIHPYRLKTGDGTQTNYCWKLEWFEDDVDDNKEYKINTCVRICSRDTIKNNNERTYLTHNCNFDVCMWQYCNNICYIDEVIVFGLWHFKLYKLRTSDNNILPYLWSNYWFYSLEDENNNCSEYKFNKQKVILNF